MRFNKNHEVWTLTLRNPWVALVPYIFLYFIGWSFGVSPHSLRNQFLVLHIFMAAAASFLLFQTFRSFSVRQWFFWCGLVLFFLLPGAYLEYPSDPWEHYRRIFIWDGYDKIGDHYAASKFAYFWGWSFLSFLPVAGRRVGVNFFSAFTQLLLAVQVLQFARAQAFSKGWDYLQTFAFFCFFGTSLFGMRYYALSSTPFAYTGYLAALVYVQRLLDGKKEPVFLFLAALLVMGANHLQAYLFCLFGFLALYLGHRMKGKTVQELRTIGFIASLVFVLSLGVGFAAMRLRPDLFQGPLVGRELLSRWGTFRIWVPDLKIVETLGVHGLIAIGFGLICFRQYLSLSLLVFIPVLALLFPPAVFAMTRGFAFDVPYRVLYAGPTSFLFIASLKSFLEADRVKKCLGSKNQVAIAGVAVVFFGILYPFPWRGRLFFQIYRPQPMRSLRFIQPTLSWFQQHSELLHHCLVLSDDMTMFAIDTELTPRIHSDQFSRLPAIRLLFRQPRFSDLEESVETRLNHPSSSLCGLLVANPTLIPSFPSSRIAASSQHWPSHEGDIKYWASSRVYEWAALYAALHGLKRIPVPPFYDLYVAP